jgi:hypothetical protein
MISLHRLVFQGCKKRRQTCIFVQFARFENRVKYKAKRVPAMETQAPQNRRRSERVLLRMSVMVLAENEQRRQIQEEAKTQVVNAHGGLMVMKSHLHMGQSFLLKNPQTGSEMSCRVVRVDEAGMEYFNIAFEFDRPAPKFWPITFPPMDWMAKAAGL